MQMILYCLQSGILKLLSLHWNNIEEINGKENNGERKTDTQWLL